MAGVTDGAWRLVARAGGAALAYSEMVSVAGIHYGGAKTWELALPARGETELAVQLFGSRPEQFREATAAVAERLGERLALIDINMACPVRKVTSRGEGSALLDEPERAASIVRACLAETQVPVTCKIRCGRRVGEEIAPAFARRMSLRSPSTAARRPSSTMGRPTGVPSRGSPRPWGSPPSDRETSWTAGRRSACCARREPAPLWSRGAPMEIRGSSRTPESFLRGASRRVPRSSSALPHWSCNLGSSRRRVRTWRGVGASQAGT